MLLDARYEDTGEPMTESQIIDEILILLIAGHETTANALSWALYLLAGNRQELSYLREATASLSVNEATMSPALAAVIKESMRLYPPSWINDRVGGGGGGGGGRWKGGGGGDDVYNNYRIPKGTVVVSFFGYGLHRDIKQWEEPLAFRPARFLGDAEKRYQEDILSIRRRATPLHRQ